MAKKKSTRRPNVSAETLARARAEMRNEAPIAEPTAATGSANGIAASAGKTPIKPKVMPRGAGLATRRMPSQEELRAQYAHVLKDMRNLVILAAALFAFIIVAAALLPSITL